MTVDADQTFVKDAANDRCQSEAAGIGELLSTCSSRRPGGKLKFAADGKSN